MQFFTFVKLALVAAQIGMVVATPAALKARQLDIICETDADCSTGEECLSLSSLLGFPGLPGICVPAGLSVGGLAKADA
ncbi:hypothetical protein PYCCODRAFT_1467913 [Trametes coccinea BRFM310]|uniref:Hydrophobin n=1 Tax=Trametes coccinea (strain BRFM310) TaxID=1353009 RepID=A0A1Y2IMB2_TRAC3|nr:hypothetical protein PYCCODRAFT_1467913 [Trametes coccinea BRFM310]